ncbi:hypothetical protein AHN50_17500 [Salmonella enterica subsp. enterica]|uniref:Uncharacterized protein n=2 Tax=Salmonella enterica I TaxID=59201 RepID=A0A624B7L9_SALMO|nr:hypothetical protein [Salmonella enterica]EAC2144387.1 hypothetical protein [Salmonella enterica subsp. enterica]EBZ5929599.1 hypothetical protein [Salmonella enterica subsp. enterica serovar Weslaco]EBZ6045832.1 hypothetical protein [Salmonella enterica subsp. enterica serovar Texas]ECS6016314.1 hypothetical protein [Salmonella enterica subsp. enterica serovar Rough O:k:1,5]ECZ5262448.1 hypothetical protein [Salmonella enterica subsp. enterica serovar Montevideo]EDH9620622.1 hypothetical 
MVGQNINVKHSALYDNTLSHSNCLCVGGIHLPPRYHLLAVAYSTVRKIRRITFAFFSSRV